MVGNSASDIRDMGDGGLMFEGKEEGANLHEMLLQSIFQMLSLFH